MSTAYTSSLLFAGFFLAAATFASAVYVTSREKPFFWYALLSGAVALTQLAYLEARPLRILSFCVFMFAQWAFATAFLQLRNRSTRQAYVLEAGAALAILTLLVQLVIDDFALRMLGHAAFIALLAACAAVAFEDVPNQQEDRVFFFAAYAGAGLAALLSSAADAFAQGTWAQYLFQFGLAWQASFLALALGNRYVKLDPLTGVKSRREFDERLPRAWRAAIAEKRGLAVVFVSIDDFDGYNAKHGRIAADGLLRRVAHLCGGCCAQPGDVFSRYGDAEFAAIVPRVTQEEAQALALRMTQLVEQVCDVRIHARVASLDAGARSATALLNQARPSPAVS